MSVFFLYLGIVILIIGWILFLIEAFKQSILWGLGCFLFAPLCIIFLIFYWQEAKSSFFIQIIGIALVFMSGMANQII